MFSELSLPKRSEQIEQLMCKYVCIRLYCVVMYFQGIKIIVRNDRSVYYIIYRIVRVK